MASPGRQSLTLANAGDEPVIAMVWSRPGHGGHMGKNKLYEVVIEVGSVVRLDSIDPLSVTVQYEPMIRPEGSGWRLSYA